MLSLDTADNEIKCELPPYSLKVELGVASVIRSQDQEITLSTSNVT